MHGVLVLGLYDFNFIGGQCIFGMFISHFKVEMFFFFFLWVTKSSN